MKNLQWMKASATALACLTLVTAMQGCAPLVLGTAAGGALMVSDRRTSGTQVEDQALELKAANKLREVLTESSHVNATSYNRLLLLTGEVSSETERAAAEEAVRKLENLKTVVNELAVMPASSISTRTNDVVLATKVRATLVDAPNLISGAFKVVVERGEVYMMGLVTEREARYSSELIATIKGVRRVVKVFQIVTEDELANKLQAPTRLNGTPLTSPDSGGASATSTTQPTSAITPPPGVVTTTPLQPADPVQIQPLPPAR